MSRPVEIRYIPIPVEWKLLLCCAHSRPGIGSAEPIQSLLGQTIRWEVLIRVACEHRMVSLLYWHLRDPDVLGVPAAALEQLHAYFRMNVARSQQLIDELGKVLALFAAHGIAAMPYKGPVVAAAVYGEPALRACGDLDILLKPSDVLRAKNLLLARGYQPQQRFTSDEQEEAHLRSDCEYNFYRTTDAMLIELHWRFRPQSFPLRLDIGGVCDRARPIAIGNMTALTLSPEDLLLILCVHGAKHCWERLIWICDVAEALHTYPDLCWRSLTARAKRLGCERVLFLGLYLARDLLGAPLPASLPSESPPVIAALASLVWRELLQDPDWPVARWERAFFHLRMRDRLPDRLPYIGDHLRRQLRQLKRGRAWRGKAREPAGETL